jgi:hypothetical protein
VEGDEGVSHLLIKIPNGIKYILKHWDYGVEAWFHDMWQLPVFLKEFSTTNMLCWRKTIDPGQKGICDCPTHDKKLILFSFT